MNKNFVFIFISSGLFLFLGWYLRGLFKTTNLDNFVPKETINKTRPLEKYSLENLSKADIKPGKITIKNLIKEDEEYNSYLFEFEFSPDLSAKTKKTTGQINFPVAKNSETFSVKPVVLMFRGYINQKTYSSGDGTRNAAKYFASNGFITIAPDFLGYGGSDSEAGDIFESRFQTYVTALTLLRTIEQLKSHSEYVSGSRDLISPLTTQNLPLFIWAHSNGGQVALTILEESGVTYPAVLWAPVSKPFPYSILYYTDDSDDNGKMIRKELSKFEENYDVENFSLTNYLENIKSPILLQQGTADEAVPYTWSTTLTNVLKSKNKEIEYIKYTGTDHNMRPVWDEAVTRDLDFFKSHL